MPEKPSEKGKAVDKLPEGTNPQDGEVHIQLPTEGAEEFDCEADNNEHYFFEASEMATSRKRSCAKRSIIIRQVELGPANPSKFREIDIVEFRLEIARSLRKAKGGAGETTKKAKNKRSRQKG